MTPFAVAHHHATPHGVVSAVAIPDAPEPVPDAILDLLPEPERAHARTLRGYRQVQFVGGRLALRDAAEKLGISPGPILTDDRGAPRLPDGLSGSVSHKSTIAVAMAARSHGWTVGVDVEDYAPARLSIAPKVLLPEEIAAIESLAESRRWFALVLRFSLKEAIYKALDPYVRRYVGFHEALVTPDLHGAAKVELRLANGEGPFEVDARYEWLWGRIVTSVRIRRVSARVPPG